MDKNAKYYYIIAFGTTCFSIVMNFLFFFMFKIEGFPVNKQIIHIGISGIFLVIIMTTILGRFTKYFNPDNFTDRKNITDAYLKIGNFPLKALFIYLFTDILFLFILFFQKDYIGIKNTLIVPLFLINVSIAMIGCNFIYVTSDKLVTKILRENKIQFFPKNLRNNRQSTKIFIYPFAISLTSLSFAFSLAFLMTDKYGGSIDNLTTQNWIVGIIFLIIFVFVIQGLNLILTTNTKTIYNTVLVQLDNLSSAQKDLTKRILINSVDELSTISGMVNLFSSNLNESITELKSGQNLLSDSGMKLGKSASDMAISLEHIAVNVEQVREKTKIQMQSVTESSTAIQEISKNIESLDSLISNQSDSVTEASSSIEELVSNISSINNAVNKMAEQFNNLNTAAHEGIIVQQKSMNFITDIAERSKSLQEANKIIETIAAQTNLLAMNAAIEAAHAGEAGKGFSVVADEIRRLAETSSEESRNINKELKQVEKTIQQIVQSGHASENAFNQVNNRINETEPLVMEVQYAIKEQQQGTNQILDALKLMNNITYEVKNGSHEMNKGNITIVKEMDNLQNSSKEIYLNIEDMAQVITTINNEAQQVSHLADTSKSTIIEMDKIVQGFIV